MFYYTILNLDYGHELFYWTKISTKQLIQSILKNYLSNEGAAREVFKCELFV